MTKKERTVEERLAAMEAELAELWAGVNYLVHGVGIAPAHPSERESPSEE